MKIINKMWNTSTKQVKVFQVIEKQMQRMLHVENFQIYRKTLFYYNREMLQYEDNNFYFTTGE